MKKVYANIKTKLKKFVLKNFIDEEDYTNHFFQKKCIEEYNEYLEEDNFDIIDVRGGCICYRIQGKEHPFIIKIFPLINENKYCIKGCEGIVQDEEGKSSFIKFKKNVYNNAPPLYTGFVQENESFKEIDYSNMSDRHSYLISKIDGIIDEGVAVSKYSENIRNGFNGVEILKELRKLIDKDSEKIDEESL